MKMSVKTTKNKKQTKAPEKNQQRSAQILFALFAIILILSMVLSAVSKF
jgi:hypothetical protein